MTEQLRRQIAALFIAVLAGVSSAAQTEPGRTESSSASAAAATTQIDIDNFGRVSPTYYRGAQPDGSDYSDLAAIGVKTLINLTSDDASADEPAMAKKSGLKYVQIPMTTHEPPTADTLARFLQIVDDPANQPVFVHCVGGRHRTGVMTAAYRMSRHGWTADQAFREMKQFKFGADFLHPEFKKFVYDFGS
ncbi:MAG TPA: dual specificity protein phosphatase family protein [Vicinamibacterales bacterium]|jgi:protein tyrosine/serine phosphatase|nr:dual specificity protein phosphatase family protein [Vicinamibacterales bacterium]